MTDVLLISAGILHPPILARYHLRRALGRVDGVRFRRVRSLQALPRLDLANYDGIVLYFHHKRLSDAALAALDGFVRGGGGVLAVHSATASFMDADAYFDILGGRFRGHGPVERIHVQPFLLQHELFAGIPAFTISDELYLHELSDDIRVHFVTEHEGETVPFVWTRTHGRGRVCYVCPGHRAASIRQPQVQAILRRGLRWALGAGDV